MPRDLTRLLRPGSIAVIGGGSWCAQVIEQSQKMGFQGDIWPVHRKAPSVAGLKTFARVADLPRAPDACFVGVNREASIDIIGALSALGAGGAVCFASGFREAQAEDADGASLQNALLAAAGEMPMLGPNCYGFINGLDRALLWPDQHGVRPCNEGVALITQSSNIAINLSMQARGLPLAYVVTAGNQAQIDLAEVGLALVGDPRVTALGLHIEGIKDLRLFENFARRAHDLGKPIVALKVGASDQARAATVSHTASLAGQDGGASALLKRLGIARVRDLPTLLETLKLLHCGGWLPQNSIATISCSGGEASLAADMGLDHDIHFPRLSDGQKERLRTALGPRVALANPLDYHTYVWGDVPAMTRAFAAMADPGIAITLLIVDFPRADICEPAAWDCTIEAATAAQAETGARYAMVATLPELMPEAVAERLMARGVVPFSGLEEALAACAAACEKLPQTHAPILLPHGKDGAALIPEALAKDALATHGQRIPQARRAEKHDLAGASEKVGFPQVLKGEGIAHKTDAGAIRLNLTSAAATCEAAKTMPSERFLVEEMIVDGVAEVLLGILHDPAHGFVLTLAAGGTLTEILNDSTSLLLPVELADVENALMELKIAPMLRGYRGAAPADLPAVLSAVMALQDYVIAHQDRVQEIEINPLICTPTDAIAADALLRLTPEKDER
ncbi:MAG: acetate--CoA ligase family protein [Pseudomonadota bacterium]